MKKDDEKLLRRIKKLLALAKSTNPHEAAQALAIAQKLMQEKGVSQHEIEISESDSTAKFARKPASYVHMLVTVIEKAFGVKCYFSGSTTRKYCVRFFGHDERPEVAAYCFDVLNRKLQSARKEFNASQSPRLKRSTLISRADAFCEGWVQGAYQSVEDFALTEHEKTMLEAHETYLYEKRNLKQGTARSAGNTRDGDSSRYDGYAQGRKVKLNHGVSGQETAKLGVM